MGKSKKKKKRSSQKPQYDVKKNNSAEALAEEAVLEADAPCEDASEVVDAAEKDAPVHNIQGTENSPPASDEPTDTEPPMPAAPDVQVPYDPDFSEKDFSDSVSELKADDIKTDEYLDKKQKEKKKISMVSNIIQLVLLFVCGTVAVVCLFMLGKNIWGKIKGQEIYSNTQFDGFTLEELDTGDTRYLPKPGADAPMKTLFERIDSDKSSVNEDTSGKYDQQLAQMKASLSALKAKNKDIYGWIYVPGTNINHPVVRCNDNNYYLDHAYTGEYLPIGAIFADLSTADVLTDNYNTVIYGHNVVSTGPSSMFHDVEKFLDHEFFKNTKIYVYTMDGAFVFEPVAIYDTVSDYFYFKTVFSDENDFLAFAKEMVTNSKFYSGATFASGDKMLTLSTCTNATEEGRYSLHAKLVEVIK